MTAASITRAAIYARYSSDRQNDRSIEDQVALCHKLAASEGFAVVDVYEDRALSAASLHGRLGVQRLLRDARQQRFDVVLTEDLDRISRDQEDLANVHKRLRFAGIAIVTAHDGEAGDIQVGVKGLIGTLFLKDLANKVRRGQAGVIRDGRHNGGRSFGYRNVPGKPGQLQIDPAEATTVKRIFAAYLDGQSPREIAATLNREGVAGPRGKHWNASTINGSRQRRNGILQNELYAGKIVWNRQRFIKDPETGKRVSRPNPQSEWMTAEAEHLRIVDQAVWDKLQSQRESRSTTAGVTHVRRPKHLLSGLVKCGCCGSSYIVGGGDRRGSVLFCSRARETGLCDNRRSIARLKLEELVIGGIEKHLAAPEIVAAYVREFHAAMRELAASGTARVRAIETRLSEVLKAIEKTVDALIYGKASRALHDRLAALEAERDALNDEKTSLAPISVTPHPNAADDYRRKVQSLKDTLATVDTQGREDAFRVIRELVEKIVIHPRGPKLPVDIEIHGQLAALLKFSESAANASAGTGEPSAGRMVAGRGFEPLTFRL